MNRTDIKIWYMMVIIPFLQRSYNKLASLIHQFRWWLKYQAYLRDIDSRLNESLQSNNDDNYYYYDSQVRLLYPLDISKGKVVMTPDGIGRILKIQYSDNDSIRLVMVELMSINYQKTRGYAKYFTPIQLTQLQVYHRLSMQFILLSPKDYVYITDENQQVNYRVTNRRYAKLSPHCKAEVEYIRIFNNHRNGSFILKSLTKAGYVIRKTVV